MKALYIISLLAVITSSCAMTPSSQKSFEGIVTFVVSVEILEETHLDEFYRCKYGDTVLLYVSSDGDYRREYPQACRYGIDYVLYSHDQNVMYAKINGLDTVLWFDSSVNSLALDLMSEGEEAVVLGSSCKSVSMRGHDVATGKKAWVTYYYSGSPMIDPELYSRHKDYFLDRVYGEAQSQYLKYEMEMETYKATFEAVKVVPQKLGKDLFRMEKGSLVKKAD